jgi:hypothetical protein
MAAHGLKELKNDIDVIARGKAWEKAKTFSDPVETNSKLGSVVCLFDGTVEIFDAWPPAGMWDVEKLINDAEVIDGIRFVQLKSVAEWKNTRKKKSDEMDIQKINDFLGK